MLEPPVLELFSQSPYRCKLEWGRQGTRAAAMRGDLLVVVDTLSFSTAVVAAVDNGGMIIPCAKSDDVQSMAREFNGEVAVRRTEVPEKGRFSLSPLTYLNMAAHTRIILPSPNGATCSRYAAAVPHLYTGALVNAGALGAAVNATLDNRTLSVTIIACGERWEQPGEDGELRVAIEDYLGAGAIISNIKHDKSPEAKVCEGAFLQMRDRLEEILWDCASGRELRARGFGSDVQFAARLDSHKIVPVMRGNAFVALA